MLLDDEWFISDCNEMLNVINYLEWNIIKYNSSITLKIGILKGKKKKKETLFINPQEPNSQKFTIEWDDSLVGYKKNGLLSPNCPKKKFIHYQ